MGYQEGAIHQNQKPAKRCYACKSTDHVIAQCPNPQGRIQQDNETHDDTPDTYIYDWEEVTTIIPKENINTKHNGHEKVDCDITQIYIPKNHPDYKFINNLQTKVQHIKDQGFYPESKGIHSKQSVQFYKNIVNASVDLLNLLETGYRYKYVFLLS